MATQHSLVFVGLRKSCNPTYKLPCDVVFDPEEWQAAWTVKYRCKPPQQTPKLGEMVRIIAGFGGFLGRKNDGFPGAKTLWEGMEKVRHYALGIEIARAVYANSD